MKSNFNPEQYAAEYKAKHHTYERYAYGIFKSALDAQIAPVKSHLKNYGSLTDSIVNMLITKAPIEAAYSKVYQRVGVISAGWTMKKINGMGRKASPGFFSEKWRKLMELFFNNEAADRVSDVTDTTRDRVKKVLADSLDLPISERATYIENQLGSDFNRARSLMIARTESTTAANKGVSLGNADADYETNKQWLAIEDNSTRTTHIAADGQQVDNDSDFIVGGELAQYPGDMRLSAKEVINCRCTAVYRPVLSSSGIPILKNR